MGLCEERPRPDVHVPDWFVNGERVSQGTYLKVKAVEDALNVAWGIVAGAGNVLGLATVERALELANRE